MWIVIFYDEDGDIDDGCYGPFDGHASADEWGSIHCHLNCHHGYRVLQLFDA